MKVTSMVVMVSQLTSVKSIREPKYESLETSFDILGLRYEVKEGNCLNFHSVKSIAQNAFQGKDGHDR